MRRLLRASPPPLRGIGSSGRLTEGKPSAASEAEDMGFRVFDPEDVEVDELGGDAASEWLEQAVKPAPPLGRLEALKAAGARARGRSPSMQQLEAAGISLDEVSEWADNPPPVRPRWGKSGPPGSPEPQEDPAQLLEQVQRSRGQISDILSPPDAPAESIQDEILRVFGTLPNRGGANWRELSDLRPSLDPKWSRGEVDTALTDLLRSKKVDLTPHEANNNPLRRDSSVNIGMARRDLISLRDDFDEAMPPTQARASHP